VGEIKLIMVFYEHEKEYFVGWNKLDSENKISSSGTCFSF
jgi:hypothetical protein